MPTSKAKHSRFASSRRQIQRLSRPHGCASCCTEASSSPSTPDERAFYCSVRPTAACKALPESTASMPNDSGNSDISDFSISFRYPSRRFVVRGLRRASNVTRVRVTTGAHSPLHYLALLRRHQDFRLGIPLMNAFCNSKSASMRLSLAFSPSSPRSRRNAEYPNICCSTDSTWRCRSHVCGTVRRPACGIALLQHGNILALCKSAFL